MGSELHTQASREVTSTGKGVQSALKTTVFDSEPNSITPKTAATLIAKLKAIPQNSCVISKVTDEPLAGGEATAVLESTTGGLGKDMEPSEYSNEQQLNQDLAKTGLSC
jgi:hypothetical protein